MHKYLIITLLSTQIFAKDIVIAFTKSMNPYLIEKTDSGIEFDIIKSAFKASGLTNIVYKNVHWQRAILLLKSKDIDAAVGNLTNKAYHKIDNPIFESKKTIDYVDCAISLKKRKLNLDSWNAYSNKTVWAFKSATEVLGKEFKKAVSKNENYAEKHDQKLQLRMLVANRVDVVISDKNIFLNILDKEIGADKRDLFAYKQIIPVTPRNLKFHNKELQKKFDQGLKLIKKNGDYERILGKYRTKYEKQC